LYIGLALNCAEQEIMSDGALHSEFLRNSSK
jgi:hypothetical protein